MRNRPIVQGTAIFGEVGLGGEVRGVPQAPLRLREARQPGYTRVVLPSANLDDASRKSADEAGTTLVGVRHVGGVKFYTNR